MRLFKPIPTVIMLLAVGLLFAATGTGYCAEFAQIDATLSKHTAKALSLTEKGLPAIATVIIIFYLFKTLCFRMLTDHSVHKWAGMVVINVAFLSAFFGNSISSVFGVKHSAPSQIQRVVTDTYPGTGAIESATPTGSGTHFEVLASEFDNTDEALASGMGDNLAMVQTVTDELHTRWALDMSSTISGTISNTPGNGLFGWVHDLFASGGALDNGGNTPSASKNASQQSLQNSIASINADEANNSLLSGCLLYLNNAVISVAGTVAAGYDGRQMERAAQGEEATGGVNPSGLALQKDDLFAEVNLNIATNTSSPVTVVTMATYPGGVDEYGRHALDYIANPDKNYHAGTIPAAQITSAIDASKQTAGSISSRDVALPSPTASGPGTVADYAKQQGFDAEKEGVYPQYYLRAHSELQASECSSNASAAGLRPGSYNGGGSSIFNPVSNIPTLPIPTNTAQLTQAAGIFGILNGLGTQTGGSLLGSLISTLQATDQMYSKLANYQPTFSNPGAAAQTTISSISAQYDQLIADSAANGMSHATNCLKNGKAMLSVTSAISKASGDNDLAFHKWLDADLGSAGSRAEAESTLAWNIGKEVDPDILATKNTENMASIAGIVNHVVGYVSAIGADGGHGSMNTKVPTTQESSAFRPDKKLEAAANYGKDVKDKALADKSMNPIKRAAEAVYGGLVELIAKYYRFLLRLLAVLFAGLPFIALLTQVSIVTHVAYFSYAIGMGILPIWAVMNTGKLFSNASAGDDSYNGVSFFPIITIILTTCVLAAEVAGAKLCQSEVQYYLTHIIEILSAQIEASLRAIGVILDINSSMENFSFNKISAPMMLATKPFGICAAAVIAPALIARMITPGILALHASASMVSGMASSASQGGAGHIASSAKRAASAALAAKTGGASKVAEGAGKSAQGK